MMTPYETMRCMAERARGKRLSLNLSQEGLGARSGVSCSVIKKFEYSGKISLESLLKIAMVLGSLEGFAHLFHITPATAFSSLEQLLEVKKTRKRGRL